jgi:Holliday junction resolvase RusA-like endonuclease
VTRDHLITIRVNGVPKSQPRPRAFVRGNRAAVYDPGTAEGWKSEIAVACKEMEGALIDRPLAVALTFFMPRPKSHFRTNGMVKPTAPQYWCDSKPDVDNLAKAVLDAMTAIRVWIDDDQVAELLVRKYYESDRDGKQVNPPGCIIRITRLANTLGEAPQ